MFLNIPLHVPSVLLYRDTSWDVPRMFPGQTSCPEIIQIRWTSFEFAVSFKWSLPNTRKYTSKAEKKKSSKEGFQSPSAAFRPRESENAERSSETCTCHINDDSDDHQEALDALKSHQAKEGTSSQVLTSSYNQEANSRILSVSSI
mmetsp:Transcript_19310/g.23060  ORF Transcript_19310/g.23060 Transcript_19310/m.23060 type:complete len:146 (-) Transcript_19310:491-928(-)